MSSGKRKESGVRLKRPGGKKRRRANDDVDDGDDDDDGRVVDHVNDTDEALVPRLSRNPSFTTSQPSQTEREAGVIEEVRVMNFMNLSKLDFRYVIHATYMSVCYLAVSWIVIGQVESFIIGGAIDKILGANHGFGATVSAYNVGWGALPKLLGVHGSTDPHLVQAPAPPWNHYALTSC